MLIKLGLLRILQICLVGYQSLAGKLYSLKVTMRPRRRTVGPLMDHRCGPSSLPSLVYSKCPRRTSLMDCCSFDSPSSTTVETLKTFFSDVFKIYSKCLSNDPHDRLSFLWLSVLHNHRHCHTLCSNDLKLILSVPRRTPMKDRLAYDGPSIGLFCTLYFCTVFYFLCFVASSCTNYFSLLVQMAPKKNHTHEGVASQSPSRTDLS